jgi:enediyne biosynthesis protein E4
MNLQIRLLSIFGICIFASSLFAVPVLKPHSCSEESSLHSISGTVATSIEFQNKTSKTLKLFWINYQGKRELYQTLQPGQSNVQPTFVTHPWVVAEENNTCFSIFLPLNTPSIAKLENSLHDISVSSGIANNAIATTGVQAIDYNNDKKQDLALIGKNGNALFKNVGKGKFVNVTQQAKFSNAGRDARGASWSDINNDGFPDVVITNATGAPTILKNNHGVFSDVSNLFANAAVAGKSESGTRAAVWVDIDNDSRIDMFVVKEGVPNQLFKQSSFLKFDDIAQTAGVASTGEGRSAVAADFDEDGFQDIFLVNFKQPCKFYHNNRNATFNEIGKSSGVDFNGASIQASIVDYDSDGKPDLFIVNNEGPSFFYKNVGNLNFQKISPPALKSAKKGIAAAFVDYNLDGNQDLVLAQSQGGNRLYKNNGQGKFETVAGIDLSRPDNPTGVTVGDFNNDGIPDVMIGDGGTDQDRGDSLFKNDGGGNHITLILQGTKSNRSAIGAVALIQLGINIQAQQVTGGNGMSQESLPLEFGLGSATKVNIRIAWPSGIVQTIPDVDANQVLKITEPQQ